MAEAELATVARPYARAAFATALDEADGLVSWSKMLALLSAAVVVSAAVAVVASRPSASDSAAAADERIIGSSPIRQCGAV